MWWSNNKPVPGISKVDTSRSRTWIGNTLVISSIVGSGMLLSATANPGDIMQSAENVSYAHSRVPSAEAVINDCGHIFSFDVQPSWYGTFDPTTIAKNGIGGITIPLPGKIVVPAFGYMTQESFDSGGTVHFDANTTPGLPSLLRALYDGKKIIWYDASASELEVQRLINFATERDDIYVVEWSKESLGILENTTINIPEGRKYAFSGWGVTQSCGSFTEFLSEDFMNTVDEYAQDNPRPTIPHEVTLTPENKLPRIRA